MPDTVEQLSSAEWETLPETEADSSSDANEPVTPNPVSEGPVCVTCNRIIHRKPGARGRVPKYHPECRPSGNKSAGTKRKKSYQPSYTEGINGLFQMGATALVIAGGKNPTLIADSVAITEYGPGIAESLNVLAIERPEIAAVLDKIMQVGPYGALVAAVVPLAAQILANHDVLPAGALGVKSKEDLIRPYFGATETEKMTQAA